MATKQNLEVKDPVESSTTPVPTTPSEVKEIFPDLASQKRLQDYEYYKNLFKGNHFDAFKIKIHDKDYNETYGKMRYVMANFAGLLSKIMADMLFSEPVNIKVPDGDQEFVDALVHENRLNIQFYEAAMSASYKGDILFKLRTAPRHPENPNDASTIIIESVTPSIYFPEIDPFNVSQDPAVKVLAWKFKIGKEDYLRKEIHSYGKIENKVFKMKGSEVEREVPLDILGIDGLMPVVNVDIDECLLVHIPNWKLDDEFFGMSDYHDLETLFYAINNRLTAVDNILDKHSDPILTVPEGVLDERGQVKRNALNLFEIPEGSEGKPEYVVWNANLDIAIQQIDKLVEMLFMISETSPDLLGMGKGQADSGRALKLKLLRTIAKARRKRLYFDQGIKDIIYRAQLLAKAYNLKVGGKSLTKDPVIPEIEWQDGLPTDQGEQVETETKRIDAGLTTVSDSIMRLDSVDEDTAKKKAKEIKDEKAIEMPAMNLGNMQPMKPGMAKPISKPMPPLPKK